MLPGLIPRIKCWKKHPRKSMPTFSNVKVSEEIFSGLNFSRTKKLKHSLKTMLFPD
jgi:hypothetical protein